MISVLAQCVISKRAGLATAKEAQQQPPGLLAVVYNPDFIPSPVLFGPMIWHFS